MAGTTGPGHELRTLLDARRGIQGQIATCSRDEAGQDSVHGIPEPHLVGIHIGQFALNPATAVKVEDRPDHGRIRVEGQAGR